MKDKSNLIQVFSFLLMIVVLAVFTLNIINKNTDGEIFQFGLNQGGTPAQIIESGVTVEQTFVAHDNYLCRLDILLSNCTEPDDSDTTIKLLDEKNNVIFSETVSVHEIEPNSYRTIRFEPVTNSKGKCFNCSLKAGGVSLKVVVY